MRILLVDDDAGVVDSLAAMLRQMPGSEVRTAANGGQALQAAHAWGGVDVLITDVVMEPMDGFTLRDHVAGRYPAARVIFISGYDLSDYGAQTANHLLLTKPVEQADLFAAVAQGSRAESAVAPAAAAGASEAVPPARKVVAPAIDGEMVGQTVGTYQIERVLAEADGVSVFRALQTSINRRVSLSLLSGDKATDPAARAQFLGDARAKAHVQHPAILAVYEAGEANGQVFYSQEAVDGQALAELHAAGGHLDEPSALKVLRAAGEGLSYLHLNQIPHSLIAASDVYLGSSGGARVANLATNGVETHETVEAEIQALGRIVLSVLPPVQTVSIGLRTLLNRMVHAGPQGVGSWAALLQGIQALEPKIIPAEAAKISAQDLAAIAAVDAARRAQKRALYLNVGGMLAIVLIAAGVAWYFLAPNERTHDESIRIPAGAFIFDGGQSVELPEFWIDKYEVSIGQYAKFVKFLEEHPTSEFDHPRQPRIKTADMHKPKDWAIYIGRAREGNAIHSVPSDMNMPAIMVDWWDAYAYAKWRGRELPTEQEWEKAGRGTQGFLYPWGNDFDPKKVNSGSDFVMSDPGAPGKIDGFNYWGPVDRQPDKSPFGVVGMAGNVAEWTATWTKDNKYPIIKGGSYMSKDVQLDKRSDTVPPNTAQENIGFRTVSHSSPKP